MTQQTIVGHIPAWTVGDRLRKAREDANLSQKELADLTGVSQRSISAYEGQAKPPRRPVLLAIHMATGVPMEWLETGQASTPGPEGTSAPGGTRTPQPSDPKVVVAAFGRPEKVAAQVPAAA